MWTGSMLCSKLNRSAISGFLAALFILCASSASAQTVSASATISWTLPTVSVDGVPMTGAHAITGVEVYISTSPIADTSTMAPTLTLGAVSTVQHSMDVPNGSTLYVRVKAVNAGGKSVFSNQATKLIQLDTKPGAPTSVTIILNVVAQ